MDAALRRVRPGADSHLAGSGRLGCPAPLHPGTRMESSRKRGKGAGACIRRRPGCAGPRHLEPEPCLARPDGWAPSKQHDLRKPVCPTRACVPEPGLVTHTGEAPGSLCDGRFNLLADGRKLAGTAQAWRRLAGQQIGLFHAVFFLRVNPETLAEDANRLEEHLGHTVRYLAASMTSLHREVGNRGNATAPEERFLAALTASLQGVFHPLPGHERRPSAPVVAPSPLGITPGSN